MTDRKISELTQITGANVDDANDELAIVDASASETKAITRAELFSSVSSASFTSLSGNLTGNVTGNLTGNVTGDLTGDVTLEAIAASKGVTAVDVFVYDTSRDSDGGAWRKQTQHTSWYNETLNTATRGSRREFPAVAVIAAESNKITIYDGDDPALPMWMVFNQTLAPSLSLDFFRSGRNASCVYAINGQMCFGTKDNAATGLCVVPFLKDDLAKYSDSPSDCLSGKSIANRNLSVNMVGNSYPAIVQEAVNDVAMTVLPDAPIDPATGLPVPTIAVATDGGVSVIKDDGTVVDITPNVVDQIAFFSDRIYFGAETGGLQVGPIPTADVDVSLWRDYFINTSSTPAVKTLGVLGLVGDAYATPDALVRLDENTATPASSMVAYTTSTYNTGWMNGDIKGAFLSDTDDTDLVGSGELVTNGTFDTDISGWSVGGADAGAESVVSGAVRLAGNEYIYQTITGLTAGQSYTLTATIVGTNSQSSIRIGTAANVGDLYDSPTQTAATTLTTTFIPSGTAVVVTLKAEATVGSTSLYVDFDNVSVKLADADRSVNNNGLIVNGTVTRTPVATGADLVAYSGFSASNYLEQPYNSDLDFGTGDFCVMGWVKGLDPSPAGPIVERGSSPTRSGSHWILERRPSSYKFTLTDDGFVTRDDVDAGSCSALDFVCGVVRSGVAELWVNARLVASKTIVNATLGQTNTGAVLIVGSYATLSSFFPDDLALLRISATAPTAEQIRKIYEDEKFLFQENAQATLYGTSDAVTALAHDQVTDLLHVGTSAGRSVFQGLRRVSNTTTAVGTAISASNNLIVEE